MIYPSIQAFSGFYSMTQLPFLLEIHWRPPDHSSGSLRVVHVFVLDKKLEYIEEKPRRHWENHQDFESDDYFSSGGRKIFYKKKTICISITVKET